MSHGEYASRPLSVLTKLAVMLRNISVLQFAFAKFSALLASGNRSSESLISKFLDKSTAVTGSPVDLPNASLKLPGDRAIAAPESTDQFEREKLIHRRWTETGIKMWNPAVHGAGFAALNIQGRVELLPPKPGEMLLRYDKLEFNLIEGLIICEGVVVNPPKSSRRPGTDLLA
jgi:hypothetical protein